MSSPKIAAMRLGELGTGGAILWYALSQQLAAIEKDIASIAADSARIRAIEVSVVEHLEKPWHREAGVMFDGLEDDLQEVKVLLRRSMDREFYDYDNRRGG